MTALSNVLGLALASVTAGEAIAQGDAVEIGPDNLAWKVQSTDTAAVGNAGDLTSAAQGQILAQTNVQARVFYNGTGTRRPAMAKGPDGMVYTIEPGAGSLYFLVKRNGSGRKMASAQLGSGVTLNACGIDFLANGDLIVWIDNAIYIYSTGLLLKATANNGISNALPATFNVCVFSAAVGGAYYAVIAQQVGTPANIRMETYGPLGAVVTAFVVVSASGGAGVCSSVAKQMPNGNIAWAIVNSVSNTFYGVVSPALAIVKASTAAAKNGTTNDEASLAVSASGFLLGVSNGAAPYDTLGNLLGAGVTAAGGTFRLMKALYDVLNNVYYYLSTTGTTTLTLNVINPATGAVTTFTFASIVGAGAPVQFDAFVERNRLVLFFQPVAGANAPFLVVIDLVAMSISTTATAVGSPAGTTSGTVSAVLAIGDFAFAAIYDVNTTAGTFLFFGKYGNTAIVGRAVLAAAAGAQVSAPVAAGSYAINVIGGSEGRAFDQTANSNITGAKGALLRRLLITKGF